ncbi:MAG: CpaD family pilus assembly protein [Sphingomicrobium sp.]
MRSKIMLIALGSTLAACTNSMARGPDVAAGGMASVNVPVVSRSDYVFDAAAPGGMLAPSESARLDGWFQGLDVRYGDEIYLEGASDAAREQIAVVAGQYGLGISAGTLATAGLPSPEIVRVIVSRTVANVPGCPNWSVPSHPNYANTTMSNFGCGMNSNLAAMVANPEDLVHGRSPSATADARTATKPVSAYRNATPTGNNGLMDISTKKGDK